MKLGFYILLRAQDERIVTLTACFIWQKHCTVSVQSFYLANLESSFQCELKSAMFPHIADYFTRPLV